MGPATPSSGKSQAELEEEYRKWREDEGHSSHAHDYLEVDSGRYSLRFGSGFPFFEKWKLKLGISAIYTAMLSIPYFSYWLWFVLLPPLTLIMPTAPSLMRGLFIGDWDFNGIFGHWAFFGDGGPPALFLPSLFGATFFLSYFYILNNIFIPKYRPYQHLLISLFWVLAFLSFAF